MAFQLGEFSTKVVLLVMGGDGKRGVEANSLLGTICLWAVKFRGKSTQLYPMHVAFLATVLDGGCTGDNNAPPNCNT